MFDGYRDELTIDIVDEIYGDIDTEGMLAQTDTEDGGPDAGDGTGESNRLDRPTGGEGSVQ